MILALEQHQWHSGLCHGTWSSPRGRSWGWSRRGTLAMKGATRSTKSWAGPVGAGGGSWNFRAPVGLSRGWHSLMVPHTTFGSDWGSRRVGAWGAVSAPSPCSPPSPGHFHPHLHLTKFLSQAPRASLALQDPKTSKTVGKCKSKVGGGGDVPSQLPALACPVGWGWGCRCLPSSCTWQTSPGRAGTGISYPRRDVAFPRW